VIRRNAHKYCISAQCKILGISRGSYYYEAKPPKDESELEEAVKETFKENREVYGSPKLKKALEKKKIIISKRKICRIMSKFGLVSAYTRKKCKKPVAAAVNEAVIPNLLDRQFDNQPELAVVVSDLTYVRVREKWHYICILLDLYNREIIGYSSGAHKNAELVRAAFAKFKGNLSEIQMFHTDRGSEFDNILIDDLLDTFGINRSLSLKGCPYDNAVAEATFKLIKAEFVNRRFFYSQEHLDLELFDYVHWFNNIRIHGTLDYLSPAEFKSNTLSFLCK
jgi:putative transposase